MIYISLEDDLNHQQIALYYHALLSLHQIYQLKNNNIDASNTLVTRFKQFVKYIIIKYHLIQTKINNLNINLIDFHENNYQLILNSLILQLINYQDIILFTKLWFLSAKDLRINYQILLYNNEMDVIKIVNDYLTITHLQHLLLNIHPTTNATTNATTNPTTSQQANLQQQHNNNSNILVII